MTADRSSVGGQAHHEVLGVPANASVATIRSQFLKEARKWHPDKRPQGESEEEAAQAHARFIALHASYEALMSVAEQYELQEDPTSTAALITSAFQGSKEAYEEARRNFEEAQAYVDELKQDTLKGHSWTREEMEVLRKTWTRAFRGLECLRREMIMAEVRLRYARQLEEYASTKILPEPAEEPTPASLDGPRTMSDTLEGACEAMGEIFQDVSGVCGSYFDAWRVIRAHSWFNGSEAITA